MLPYTAGIPPVSAGSFSVLESRATGAPDVVYLENKTRIFFVDAETEVDRYARDFELLTEIALPPERIHRIHPHHRRSAAEGKPAAAALTVRPPAPRYVAGRSGMTPPGPAVSAPVQDASWRFFSINRRISGVKISCMDSSIFPPGTTMMFGRDMNESCSIDSR